ncbi:MAG: DUF4136 domain-containing protein [Sphingomonadaceae bacterium]|nr:DUF4136 domain-containing protein [Sphingomonadaceae bacterium]
MLKSTLRTAFALAATAALLGACTATLPAPEVTRFHRGDVRPSTVYVEQADPRRQGTLEFGMQADAVRAGWARLGFRPVPDRAQADYVSRVDFTVEGRAVSRGAPVTIGLGGGGASFGRGGGFGLGGGVSFPVGQPRASGVATATLFVDLRRAQTGEALWEGRASVTAQGRSVGEAAQRALPLLEDAVFSDFPGPSGQTTRYKPRP